MAKRKQALHPDAPLLFPDHPRPVTRRDFLRQGLLSGMGVTLGGSLFSLFANPRLARAALSSDMTDLAAQDDVKDLEDWLYKDVGKQSPTSD